MAVITVGTAQKPSRVGIVVTGVEKAPDEDMRILRARHPGRIEGTGHFIRVQNVNIDGTADGRFTGPFFNGEIGTTGDAGGLRPGNEDLVLPHCRDPLAAPETWKKGSRFETCQVIFAKPDRVRLDFPGGGAIYWE